MTSFLDSLQAQGQNLFSSESAMASLGCSPDAWFQSAARLVKKHRLARPKRGFYLILRPEDQAAGAPDPIRWIDPFMRGQGVDYRISLLRAAAFHGSSHQSAMVFQVIVPRQLRPISIGRHRVQFVYQEPGAFAELNRPEWLDQIKSDAGYAAVAGIELTLLDSIRYFHKAAGINGAAQIIRDLGAKAVPAKLALAARVYENSAVRRLGFLLERFGHARQAKALLPFAHRAKSMKLLDPSVRSPTVMASAENSLHQKNATWQLEINAPVEIDA